jgi:hypothetical protein
MSEDKVPYGDEAEKWEKDAQELRALMDSAGLTQIAAGKELDVAERTMRGYCSGREPVPRAILFAMRWLVEHKPNNERWLQVHWKKAGLTVSRHDKFRLVENGKELSIRVNGGEAIHGTLDELTERGIVSLHTSYSSDRFRLHGPEQADGDSIDVMWLVVPEGKPFSEYDYGSSDQAQVVALADERPRSQVWKVQRVR